MAWTHHHGVTPFKISADVPRGLAVQKYEDWIRERGELMVRLPELFGKQLACHCKNNEKCLGDVLIKLCKELLPPPEDAAVEQAAIDRGREGRTGDLAEASSAPPSPHSPGGHGQPLWVGRGRRLRRFVDGGGICSPGCWPPDRRLPRPGIAEWLHRRLKAVVKGGGCCDV